MNDKSFLTWIHERLEHKHGESHNVDYMHKLRSIIGATSDDAITPCELNVDVSGWTSVNDKLPRDGNWYLITTKIHTDKIITTMAFLCIHEYSGDKLVSWLTQNDTDMDEWDGVTHWMPLPAPPAL